MLFATVSFSNATNEKDQNTSLKYPDCWAAANAAEVYSSGSVRCDFDYWDAVYSACMNYQ